MAHLRQPEASIERRACVARGASEMGGVRKIAQPGCERAACTEGGDQQRLVVGDPTAASHVVGPVIGSVRLLEQAIRGATQQMLQRSPGDLPHLLRAIGNSLMQDVQIFRQGDVVIQQQHK